MTTDHPAADPLTVEEVNLILEALDSHEYWQLSDPAWRQDGAVVLPSDDPVRWAERTGPTDEQQTAIRDIERSRALAARLRQPPDRSPGVQ